MNKNKWSRRLFIKSLSIRALSLLSFPQILKAGDRIYADISEDDLSLVSRLLEEKKPVTWLFTGDSITQGAKHTNGMRAFPEIFGERVRWEINRPYDIVINTAISGNASQNIVNDFELRVAKYNPDVVFLMIGTNDAAIERDISPGQFGENLLILIERIRAIKSIPILMSPNRIVAEQSLNRSRLEDYVFRMREVVKDKNIVFVDNWEIWNNELQNKYEGKVNKKLLNDLLHPNGYGHKELAIALFKRLSIFDPSSPTCIN